MARMILSLNGQTLAEYNLSKERYTVGRLPDNDIRIDNPAVSGHHSLVINILNDSFLEDLNSTNGTYVNGKLIKKHALANGDVITIGHHQLRFVDAGVDDSQEEFEKTMVISTSAADVDRLRALTGVTPDEPLAPVMLPGSPARLQVLTGAFAGRELVLKKPLTTLGRPGIQVIAITRRGENYSMVTVDRGKAGNPPMVNGEAVGAGARRLNDNDVIEIAGVKMGFFTN
ncbi:FHA domain-containing protein [Wenzhouxiangella sp. XN24]|uniref:FHA domain-containing protein n=1 Tax=Wenzhouxiangella sp. XN24 TaxID=2713569 RepID=UPI0013ECB926|nr:FHA domain-containing protein [Wenzhouxiangella sp. XN24]NGX15480.1 FHA domain-containing protein [Wenzhouxiangella sp. XN24]